MSNNDLTAIKLSLAEVALGGSLEQLVQSAAKIMDSNICISNSLGEIITASPSVDDDNKLDKLSEGDKSFAIELDGEMIAVLSISKSTVDYFDPIADYTANLVRRVFRYLDNATPGKIFSTELFMEKLALGTPMSDFTMENYVQIAGWSISGHFAMLIADIENNKPTRQYLTSLFDSLELSYNVSPLVIESTVLLFFRQSTDTALNHALDAVSDLLAPLMWRGVRSRRFTNLNSFHNIYERTKHCLDVSLTLIPYGSFQDFNDLEMGYICSIYDYKTPDDLHPVVQQLLEMENNAKFSCIETLYTYLSCGQNALKACQILHIHRNTLEYRLHRILEYTNLDLTDGKILFGIFASLCAVQHYKNTNTQ